MARRGPHIRRMGPRRDERLLVAAWLDSRGRASAERVIEWLIRNVRSFGSIFEFDVRREPCLVLDLGATSPLLNAPDADNSEPALTTRIHRAMQDAGVRLAAGRYDELRPPYSKGTDADTDAADPRSVHLGVDLFVEAGMMVHAPLAGVVHEAGASDAPLGFGPSVLLSHQTDDGTRFFTRYAHLDRTALTLCAPGRAIAPGAQLGRIGTPDVNGGWTPHLHVQLITDLLGLGRRFPGVGRLSQRHAWRLLSPNPNLVLGIPVLS
jgi:murein DD-endopeptidase MepM/ murein hydrolase activator NlpD